MKIILNRPLNDDVNVANQQDNVGIEEAIYDTVFIGGGIIGLLSRLIR